MYQIGNVYWNGGRVFILCQIGRKYLTGLVIEADGLHTQQVGLRDKLQPASYHGKPYPARKMRGWLRKLKPATKAAKKFRKSIIEQGA